MHITLHIERLILEGLPLAGRDGALVQAAVEAELARLLAEEGLAAGLREGGALRRVQAPGLHLRAGGTPTELGQQIGQAVYGGMGDTDLTPSPSPGRRGE